MPVPCELVFGLQYKLLIVFNSYYRLECTVIGLVRSLASLLGMGNQKEKEAPAQPAQSLDMRSVCSSLI